MGLYSVLGASGAAAPNYAECSAQRKDPVDEYEKLLTRFKSHEFDADRPQRRSPPSAGASIRDHYKASRRILRSIQADRVERDATSRQQSTS